VATIRAKESDQHVKKGSSNLDSNLRDSPGLPRGESEGTVPLAPRTTDSDYPSQITVKIAYPASLAGGFPWLCSDQAARSPACDDGRCAGLVARTPKSVPAASRRRRTGTPATRQRCPWLTAGHRATAEGNCSCPIVRSQRRVCGYGAARDCTNLHSLPRVHLVGPCSLGFDHAVATTH
jgi:hypothetical protein